MLTDTLLRLPTDDQTLLTGEAMARLALLVRHWAHVRAGAEKPINVRYNLPKKSLRSASACSLRWDS